MKQKFTGMRHTALVASIGKSSARRRFALGRKRTYPYYAICIDNRGNTASLMLGKAYRVIKPQKNDSAGMLRVIDEDREDYLYDGRQFVAIDLPPKAFRALANVRD